VVRLQVILATVSGSQFGAIDVAWAIVATETYVALAFWTVLLREGSIRLVIT
jgi:hypothetical protein